MKTIYLGIDGEGQGKRHHKYIFLACSTEDTLRRWSVEDKQGISTIEALEFILRLPIKNHKIFAYAFGYDLTKILEDCDNETLYKLFRPELRQRLGNEAVLGPYPVWWKGFELNYQGSKFSVKRGNSKVTIWDIFKFYQSKFVGALKDWKVGSQELLDRMQHMKDQRADFDKLDFEQVKEYCFEECACMAELARKLTEAHEKVGLKLRSYYGAGSSAAAMLDTMSIKQKLFKNYPKGMDHAVASAFFGGRFENAVIGPVEKTVYSYDISSAYPYQLLSLPCLEHSLWRLSKLRKDLERSDTISAIVHYELENHNMPWSPFPFRMKDGSICFPRESKGGWVYQAEYLQGERLFPSVRFKKAWICTQTCDCRPFARISDYYCERCRIGKEGPGIVLKLGCNSCYGKLAQSVGNAQYNSWLWAGLITSGTRAQFLEMLGLHSDMRNCLMVATDGLCSLEKIQTPKPKETGTSECLSKDGKKIPLGGWEEKIIPQGMFLARPGLYFPLNPTETQIKEVRGRGIGKKTILEQWQKIVDAWPPERMTDKVAISNVSRFCGAKSSIHMATSGIFIRYKRAAGYGKKPAYGQWIIRGVDISFNPKPKREAVLGSKIANANMLELRNMRGLESLPYENVSFSEEDEAMTTLEEEALEQPDCDLTEYL